MDRTTSSTPAVAITERQRLTLLMVAVGGHALKHLFNSAFFVLLPEIKTGLGLSNVQVGILSTLRNVAGGVANVPAGFMGDRFHRQRAGILGLSIVGIGAFFLVLGLATSYWAAVAAAALMIISLTFWHPAAISALSQQFAARRGFAIALHGTGGSVGEALGPLIAGGFLSFLAWRTVLQGSVLPALILGGAIWLVLRTVPTEAQGVFSVRDYLGSVRQLLRKRRLILILLFAGGFGGGQSVVFTFLPIYVREDLGASSFILGIYLFLAQAAGIGSQPLMGYLSDRLNRKVILAPSLTILGLSILSLYLAPEGWPFVIVIIIMGAFLFSLMSILLASAMDLVASDIQATTVSLVFGSAVVVSGMAPYIGGLFADAFGVKTAFLWAAGIVLTTAFVATVTRWQQDPA